MLQRLRTRAASCAAAARALLRLLFSPMTIGFALILAGCGMLVAGVIILFGTGWALVVGAALALLSGALLVREATRGASDGQ